MVLVVDLRLVRRPPLLRLLLAEVAAAEAQLAQLHAAAGLGGRPQRHEHALQHINDRDQG